MAIPAGVTRFVLVGTAPGGEIFNTGFYVNQAYDNEDDLRIACGVVGSYWTGHFTTIKTLCRPDTVYTDVRGYTYPTPGPDSSFVASNPIVGGACTGAGGAQPLQLSVCVTLLTEMAGRSRRGRMYLPATAKNLDNTTHQLTTTDTQNIANDMAGFFNAINSDNTDITGSVSVVSPKLSSATEVLQVKVDTRLDIQRRRANHEAVTGSSLATVTP